MAEKFEYTDIIVDRTKPPIGYITINRPEKRNALSTVPGGTCDQLDQAYTEMADDPEIRVFILQGAGGNFSAGFDLGSGQWTGEPLEGSLVKGREKEAWCALPDLTGTILKLVSIGKNAGGTAYGKTRHPLLPWCEVIAWGLV